MRRQLYSKWMLFAASVLHAATASPQQADPVLHRRAEVGSEPSQATELRGPSLLPPEASGEYRLGDSSERIQITIDPGALSGYITRLGDGDGDQGAPLTYFFARTWMGGHRLGFETQQVHGVSYTFEGTVSRGTIASSDAEDGEYLLSGTLTSFDAAQKTTQRRTIRLKSAHQGG